MKKTMLALMISLAAAAGCVTDESTDLQTESTTTQAATAVGVFNTNIKEIEVPSLVPKKNICEALNNVTFATTVGGCTTTTTLSNCQYNSTTGDCSCSSTQTRSGSC